MDFDARVRAVALDELRRRQEQCGEVLDREVAIQPVEVEGQHIRLLNPLRGIWKPRQLDAALAILTAPPRAGDPPYPDALDEATGILHYHYRGTDPDEWDNRALREAMHKRVPLIYWHGVATGKYLPIFPVYVIGEEARRRMFLVDLTGASPVTAATLAAEEPTRAYAARVVAARLHQPRFREMVLRAYQQSCAVCRLRRLELVDAAHIKPDAEGGAPQVTNGLALCKLHHAAFDRFLMTVTPDYQIEVRPDVLRQRDGPMLVYGLQRIHGQRLMVLPRRLADRPDPALLEWRWERLRSAS